MILPVNPEQVGCAILRRGKQAMWQNVDRKLWITAKTPSNSGQVPELAFPLETNCHQFLIVIIEPSNN